MKIILSLSAISIFASIGSALVANPAAPNVLGNNPTHIVKLKAANLKNITGKNNG